MQLFILTNNNTRLMDLFTLCEVVNFACTACCNERVNLLNHYSNSIIDKIPVRFCIRDNWFL